MSIQQDPQTESPDEVSLTIGTRINFQYLLSQQILKFQNAIVKQEGFQSPQEVLESAIGLYEMIPDSWRASDRFFENAMQKAINYVKLDTRPFWCGTRVGIPSFKLIKKYNPYKLFHACINLLERRGLLARTLYQEIATGNLFEDLEETKIEEETE